MSEIIARAVLDYFVLVCLYVIGAFFVVSVIRRIFFFVLELFNFKKVLGKEKNWTDDMSFFRQKRL